MSTQIVSLDIRRFMRTDAGRALLEGIWTHLEGRRILRVTFISGDGAITTALRLDNGDEYRFNDEELMLETLQSQFSELFRNNRD